MRLLIGSVREGKVVPEIILRRICRLAGGFTDCEGLSAPAMERNLIAFQEFAELCRQTGVTAIKAVGTAAFRQAVNGELFAAEVRSKTGIPLDIIDGDSEARYTTSGVLSALEPVPSNALIVDIGGGSTEFVLCQDNRVVWAKSEPLGVVRLIEGHTVPTSRCAVITATIDTVLSEVLQACAKADIDPSELTLVGTAGTVTTLAALDMGMTEYDRAKVNNYTMILSSLRGWLEKLLPLSPEDREALPGMEKGRGDLIIAGIEILLCLMQKLRTDRLVISDFGILEGLLLSLQNSLEIQPFD